MTASLRKIWQSAIQQAETYKDRIPQPLADTLLLRSFGLLRIPMIAFLSPSVISSDHERTEIRIPLTYRSKNHLGSMYFGALAVGADTVVGLQAMKALQQNKDVQLVFKDFQANYLKRAEGDTHFICEEGQRVTELVEKALTSSDRVEDTIHAYATVPTLLGQERVAEFKLTLSLKSKKISSVPT